MATEHDQTKGHNGGIISLAFIANYLHHPIAAEELATQLGSGWQASEQDLIYLARYLLDLRADRRKLKTDKVTQHHLPAIVHGPDHGYAALLRVEPERVFIFLPSSAKVETMAIASFYERYTGHFIAIKSERSSADLSSLAFGFRWLFTAFWRQSGTVTQVLIAAVILQIFALVTPLFTMIIIDKVFTAGGTSTLEVLIIGMAIMAIFEFLVGNGRRFLVNHAAKKVDSQLSHKLFKHLFNLPLQYFSGKRSGDIVSKIKELETVRTFLTGSVLTALIDFPFGIIFLIVMLLFNPMLTGIVSGSIVLLFILYGVIGPYIKDKLRAKNQCDVESQSFLFESIISAEMIKSMAVEPEMTRRWNQVLDKQSVLSSANESLSGNIGQIAGFINKATIAICLWVGALSVLAGGMTAGQLIAFNMLVGRVMAPAQRVAQMLQQFHQTRLSMQRIDEVFATNTEPALGAGINNLPTLHGKYELKDLSFKYLADGKAVLENMNFSIEAGEIVGVIGRSGAGKTTLMRILQRLYLPSSGSILLDGIDLSEIDPTWLRRNIGVVVQDNQLLNLSVKDNINLSNPSASFEQTQAAARLAGADDFIRKLPKVYDTIVGERGYLISAGERQRIAIARALLSNPRILVMDEATSALDYESEQLIQSHMQQICAGRTVIIAAHRLSTLRYANKIICLEGGKVVEVGAPKELLKNPHGMFTKFTTISASK